jgi:glycosyltransferase involved in cell wall biosynthesis
MAKFKLKADILHIHAIGPALAIPYAKLLGLKVVFTHHGPDYNRDKWGKTAKMMLRLGEKLGVRYADEVIVISNVINDILKTKYKRFDAHLIYNGVSQPVPDTDADYLKSLGLAPRKYIFSMGRFVPEKNFHQLIRAFASLPDKKDYQLVLIGEANFEDDYAKALKKLARENGVVPAGFIKGTKLYTLLNNASAFVLPSSHEGLPISLLEAMSYELPVIVSDIPANKEVNLPEEDYFKVNDETGLAEKLQQHIHTGYRRVAYNMDPYDWDKIAGQTQEIYTAIYQSS